MVPIRLDQDFTHELAFRIGGATHFDDMGETDIEQFLRQCGVEDVPAFVEDFVAPLIEHLEEATPALRAQNLKSFDDLIGRETDRLVDLMHAAVDLRERDAFSTGGGGWVVS